MERLIGTWRLHASENPDLLFDLCFPCVLPALCFFAINESKPSKDMAIFGQ